MLKHLSFISVLVVAIPLNAGASSHTEKTPDNLLTGNVPTEEVFSLPPPDEPPPLISSPTEPDEPVQTEPKKPLDISVTPSSTAGGEVLFTFSLPMLPMLEPNVLKTAKHPEIMFTPAQQGTFKWRSPRELLFKPTEGQMNWGEEITVLINKAVPLAGKELALKKPWQSNFTVPYLQMAGKIASWPIVNGQPRFISFLNWHTGQIGRGPLFLLYDQSVEVGQIEKRLKVTDHAGNPLQVTVYRPENISQVFNSPIDTNYVVAMKLLRLPDHDKSVTIELPNWKTHDEPALVKHALTAKTTFKLVESDVIDRRENNRVPLKTTWVLTFNNWFKVARFKEVLQITPQPKALKISSNGYYSVQIQLELEPGTRYQMVTDQRFVDVLGNPLTALVDISFKSQDLLPVLQVPEMQVILEHNINRFPIRLRNVEHLEANVFRFNSPQGFAWAIANNQQECSEPEDEIDDEIDDFEECIEAEEECNEPEEKSNDEIDRFTDNNEYFRQSEVKLEPNVTQTINWPLEIAPGLVCVEIKAVGTGSEAEEMLKESVMVQNTNLGITTKVFKNTLFAWITLLHDASPVAGAKVSLYDDSAHKMIEGITDASGTVSLAAKNIASSAGLLKTAFLVAEGEGYVAVSHLDDRHLSQPRQFGLKGTIEDFEPLYAAVFSDRGIYRPGEVVHLKMIVGNVAGLQSQEVELQVQDSKGQQVLNKTLLLDHFGSADIDLRLKEQAAVGEYIVQVTYGKQVAIRKFQVEEYRVPTFKVSVSSEPESGQRGTKIDTVIRADYLHGGSLDGREVRWEVLRQPATFAPPAFPKYVFNLGDVTSLAGSITSGEKRLDGQGQLRVNFNATHPASAGPMRYIVEATVTDVDRQAYAGRWSQIIHPAAFYVGVLPSPRQVVKTGQRLEVPIIAVRPDGTPLDRVSVRARLERIDYHTTARLSQGGTVQMLNRPVPVEQQQCEIMTQKTAVNCTFTLPQAGIYQVRAWAQDVNHQTVQAGFKITASGDMPTAWPRFDQDQISVIADQPQYQIGDTARLVVQTPYHRAQGLLTIERDGILAHRVFEIKDNTPMLEVPITAEYAPNIFVSVILLRGRIHENKDASGFETGAPGFKIGYAKLNVEPSNRRLAVEVNPASNRANPGHPMTIDLLVRDHKGLPVSGQATLMVVDEAVLGLTGHQTPNPVAEIYAERSLSVRTAASRLDMPHARRSRLEKIFPGGDKDKAALLFGDLMALRKLFMSTAYWNPKVPVGPDGKASVEFELPDNITTYRIMAVVTDKKSRAGAADNQVLVQKPLMVQPVLPRFVYPDDELQIEALVFNGTSELGEIQLSSEFSNLKLIEGAAKRQKSIKSATSGSYQFRVKVVGSNEAIIRFAAKLGQHTDAVEVKLPILSPGTQRTTVVNKSILDTDTVSVKLPAERVPKSVQMEVVTSTTVLSELKDSVQYLMRYPNGCIEQTTSTAYPLVVLKELLPEIGIEVDQADLKKFSEAGIRRILSFQTASGGLSYWPGGSEPHAFGTAFGLTALIEAKKRGYEVSDDALAGMADYLEALLRQGNITNIMPHGGMADGDTRALFVMTLGRLGRPQPAYLSVLWHQRQKLSAFGLSFLAIAVKEMAGEQSLLNPILTAIRKAAQEEEKEAYYTGQATGGWSLDSPLRTHGASLIAFASTGSEGEMTGKLLTGLLKRKRYGLWGNTQENVFGIMGVHAAATRKAGGSAPPMEMKIQGREISELEMEKMSQRVHRLTLTESDLALRDGMAEIRNVKLKNNGNTPIILTVRAQYEVPLNENNRQASSNGFTMTRRYETMTGESLEGKVIPLGSLVRVRLHVQTDTNHNYVAIDDKLPAGLEPLNTHLKTTEKVSMGPLTAAIQRGLSVLSYSEIRDSRVAFYIDEMLPGEYEYVYVARATTPGLFLRPAGRVEAMYQPEINGMTSINEIMVQDIAMAH